jgi:hypothetical protein
MILLCSDRANSRVNVQGPLGRSPRDKWVDHFQRLFCSKDPGLSRTIFPKRVHARNHPLCAQAK